jgi:hypothetical protein
MAQDDDFELPLTAAPGEHANDAAQEPVQQTHQHDAQSEPITSTAARRNRISLPHRQNGGLTQHETVCGRAGRWRTGLARSRQ